MYRGRDKPRYVVSPGGAPTRNFCDNEAASGYPGFRISYPVPVTSGREVQANLHMLDAADES